MRRRDYGTTFTLADRLRAAGQRLRADETMTGASTALAMAARRVAGTDGWRGRRPRRRR